MMYCGKCGKEIKDTAKFCPYCGQAMSEFNNQAANFSYRQQKRGANQKYIIWILTGIIGVLAIIIFYLLFAKVIFGGFQTERYEDVLTGVYQDEWEDTMEFYDDGTLTYTTQNGPKTGTYEKLEEGKWIVMIDGYAYNLLANLAEEGDIYMTAESSNWDPEYFYKIE